MYCRKCGAQIDDEAAICLKCGVPTHNFKQSSPDPQVIGGDNAQVAQSLLVLAYLTAVLFPIVGFILGIYLIVKGAITHGVLAMVLALCFTFCWLGFYGG